MRLPDKYETQMKSLLKEDYENYRNCLDSPMYHGLRVNTHKISVPDFLRISPFRLSPVPWCPNGFYYDEDIDKPSRHPYYYAGLYYLQEPSAMISASVLPVEKGDRVLDICAAPGGKSTELAAKLDGSGFLVSNDISASRAKALLKNLEVFGITNMMITCEPPNTLAERFAGYFDKILIDAPCSGEGMFRKSQAMVTAWEQNGNEMFASIQKGILKEAVKMLKPGGILLYSTCTFSPLENEKSIEYLLSLDDSLHLLEVPKCEGFDDGHPEWSDTGNPDLVRCARLFPHRIKGEGHFAALIQKGNEKRDIPVAGYQPKRASLSEEAKAFLSSLSPKIDWDRLEVKNDKLYYIQEGCPEAQGLRILRQGLFLGEMKKNRFEPSQALAMALTMDAFMNTLNLPVSDIRVTKYLKGESIELMENDEKKGAPEGWILICTDGYPLGFGKLKNGVIKNKYLPGWRMM